MGQQVQAKHHSRRVNVVVVVEVVSWCVGIERRCIVCWHIEARKLRTSQVDHLGAARGHWPAQSTARQAMPAAKSQSGVARTVELVGLAIPQSSLESAAALPAQGYGCAPLGLLRPSHLC